MAETCSLKPESAQDARIEAFPGLHLGREVAHPRLLVLAGGVEGGVICKAGLLGHRCEDVLALLDGAAVDHREDGVGPIFVGGTLVAVGDGLVVGERVTHLVDAFVGHPPDPHGVGPEAGLAVVEDRGKAAHDLAVAQIVGPLQKILMSETDLPSPQVERPRRQRYVLLEGPDGCLVILRDVPVGALAVGFAVLRGLLFRGGAGVHIQGHPDLEELQGGQDTGLLGAANVMQHVHGAFKAQAGVGRDGHRVPEVELVVAFVVVGDAGVGVDGLGALVELVASDPKFAPDGLERLPLQRDLALDPVEYLPVGAVHHATAGSCAYHALRALLDDFFLQDSTITGATRTRYENVYSRACMAFWYSA